MTFKPGQSGNPSGRAKGLGKLRELAQVHTESALQTLVDIMNNKQATENSRVAAANSLLDRGWGKPSQAITGLDDQPLIPEPSQMSRAELRSSILALIAVEQTSGADSPAGGVEGERAQR